MKIRVNKEKCTGCHLCEIICSLSHLGAINTEKSAIRILKDDLDTSISQPLICRQCKEMKCLEGEDITEDVEKMKFIWNKERAERCPFKSLKIFEQNAYHCNTCYGNPQCVKVCTSHAIHI